MVKNKLVIPFFLIFLSCLVLGYTGDSNTLYCSNTDFIYNYNELSYNGGIISCHFHSSDLTNTSVCTYRAFMPISNTTLLIENDNVDTVTNESDIILRINSTDYRLFYEEYLDVMVNCTITGNVIGNTTRMYVRYDRPRPLYDVLLFLISSFYGISPESIGVIFVQLLITLLWMLLFFTIVLALPIFFLKKFELLPKIDKQTKKYIYIIIACYIIFVLWGVKLWS